jgi:ceramide glucosyltransferase
MRSLKANRRSHRLSQPPQQGQYDARVSVIAGFFFVIVLVSGLALPLGLLAVQRFYAQPEPNDPAVWPSVSILKPVKGLDADSEIGFRSFIEQDYPGRLEVVFAVEGLDDPVVPLIQKLQAEHPQHEIKLIDSSPRQFPMGKANNVIAAQKAATGEVYISADSDLIANPDDVKRMVRLLVSRPNIGAVGAIPVYRGMQDVGAGLMGAYYSPFMVLLYTVKDFFGARDVFPGTYYAIRPEALAQAGGFERVADNIADDSTMGAFLKSNGFESVMSKVTASIPEPTKSLETLFEHQHRWNLTYRATLPLAVYLLEPLLHPFILALLLPFVFSLAGWSEPLAWFTLGAYLISRWFTVATINSSVLHEPTMNRWLWWMPVSELVLTVAWAQSLLQPVTVWRGVKYRIEQGGKLVRLE